MHKGRFLAHRRRARSFPCPNSFERSLLLPLLLTSTSVSLSMATPVASTSALPAASASASSETHAADDGSARELKHSGGGRVSGKFWKNPKTATRCA